MTDAQRRANQKWDRANNTVLGCKLRKEEAEAFKAACREDGTTPNAVFLSALRNYMAKRNSRGGPDESNAEPI